jgi:hypothetical protein
MGITSIPIVRALPGGGEEILGEVTHLPCSNCELLRRVADMIQDHRDGSWHCIFCNGKESRAYKRAVAHEARQLRKVGRA